MNENRARRRVIRGAVVASVVVAAGLGAILARPVYHLTRTVLRDRNELTPVPRGYIDDASRLDQTRVREVWAVPADAAEAEAQLAALLRRAAQEALPVSIAGVRHSMGGHTIAPDGIVIDMRPFHAMTLDESRDVLQVQSGAIWADIIRYLDARDRSVIVMQSNNSFTVGGSLSVNCHGWQIGRAPIASTVESYRIMLANGEIVRCSRSENPELFGLALGGYGLFGVILDVELRVTNNVRLKRNQTRYAVDETLSAFGETRRRHPDAAMMYGRLNIAGERFLEDIIMIAFDPVAGEPPALAGRQAPGLRRAVFRGSAGSEYGKRLRWNAETELLPRFSKDQFSRNELLNESTQVYENRSAASTDILHEYFVPRERVGPFLAELRRIVPAQHGDLLNVTVRGVEIDTDTYLRYADRPMFAFVMLFTQPRDERGEEDMAGMTREMIDAAIACGGRYYLPYRLHATPEQFHRAYPQAQAFFAKKRQYDPGQLFRSMFYDKYGAAAR